MSAPNSPPWRKNLTDCTVEKRNEGFRYGTEIKDVQGNRTLRPTTQRFLFIFTDAFQLTITVCVTVVMLRPKFEKQNKRPLKISTLLLTQKMN